MDVHLHTGINLRRYLLKLDGISLKNKLLLLLTWQSGSGDPFDRRPDGALPAARYESGRRLARADAGRAARRHQTQHLQPAADGLVQGHQSGCDAGGAGGQETINLATQYVKSGYDPQAFIARLAEIVCHDNFTEMHAFKHHQSIVEEYNLTREPWRWMHLVCGAQAAAISFGKNMTIYEEYLELLHAA